MKTVRPTVCGKKTLPLPFNETERAVHDPFEVRAYLPSVLIKYYYIRIALSALARGSLLFLLKSATCSLNHT